MGKFHAYPDYVDSGLDWLGNLPAGWKTERAKLVFREINDRSEDGSEQLLSVSEYYGVKPRSEVIDEGEYLSRAESLEGYKKCQPNDLVMNIMLAWKRGLAFTRFDGIVSPAYSVFRLRKPYEPSYLNYLLRTDVYTGLFKRWSTGVIDSRLRLYPEVFGALPVVIPPASEQARIAAFLDHETAKIDRLIAKQERLIELLKEKRQAVISHAVAKGLTNSPGANLNVGARAGGPQGEGQDGPSSPDAPMKDSGVEWLGEVPAHWAMSQLRYEARPGTSITYGIVQAGPDIEGGVPYIRTSDMSGSVLPADGYMRTSEEIDYSYRRSKVRTGDLVIAIRATVGKTLPVPSYLDGANLTQGTAKFSPGSRVDSGFVLNFLSSEHASNHFWALAKGATFKEITLDMLRRFPLPLPPLDEQMQIAKHLEAKLNKFHLLIGKAERAIELQKEHRTALISAAVTGKIDVRGWQKPNNAPQEAATAASA